MVQQLKVSVLTAAVSSAGLAQPAALNYAAIIPMIAVVVRILSEMVRQSLPETWQRSH